MEYTNRPVNRLKDLKEEIKSITWLKTKKEIMKHRDTALAEIENILAQVPFPENQGVLVCDVCKRRFKVRKYRNMDICSSECFTAEFWLDKLRKGDNFATVRINGNQYYIGPEDDKGGFRGFAGRIFQIRFDDGRIVKTSNLWHNGEIPNAFRKLLPDNAVFESKITGEDIIVYTKSNWPDKK